MVSAEVGAELEGGVWADTGALVRLIDVNRRRADRHNPDICISGIIDARFWLWLQGRVIARILSRR